MKSVICPYLGLRDDPSTILDFPSEGNFCHRASSIPPVNRDYQRAVCMVAEHVNCPVFISGDVPFPPGLVAPRSFTQQALRLRWIAIPVLLLLVGWLFKDVWQNIDLSQLLAAGRGTASSNRENSSSSPATEENASPTSASLYSPLQRMIPTVVFNPSLVPCMQPAGWVQYTVKPTDSLFLLSLVYGVSISDLQTVNCLEPDTVLKPGTLIFVPGAPTATVIPSPTITPTSTRRPANPPVQPTRSRPQATRGPQPTDTQRPPTEGPKPTDTNPPPTQPPPTATPRPPTQPPPTSPPNPTPTSPPPVP